MRTVHMSFEWDKLTHFGQCIRCRLWPNIGFLGGVRFSSTTRVENRPWMWQRQPFLFVSIFLDSYTKPSNFLKNNHFISFSLRCDFYFFLFLFVFFEIIFKIIIFFISSFFFIAIFFCFLILLLIYFSFQFHPLLYYFI